MTDELRTKIANYLFLTDGQLILFAANSWIPELLRQLILSQNTQKHFCNILKERNENTEIWDRILTPCIPHQTPGLSYGVALTPPTYNKAKSQAWILISGQRMNKDHWPTAVYEGHIITLKRQQGKPFISNEHCEACKNTGLWQLDEKSVS
jgi:hypothetical protein